MAAVIAIVAACGSSSSTVAPGSAAPATPTGTAAASAAGNQAPASTAPSQAASPAAGALPVLNVQLFDTQDSFFPWSQNGTYSDSLAMELQWDQLAAYDENGQPQMRLADSITPSADVKTWTVKLKPGLTWSDGAPLTSKDVVFTWKVNANPNQSYNAALWTNVVGVTDWQKGPDFSKDIAGITAPDDTTVVFQLVNANAGFLATLLNFRNYILPSAQLLKIAPNFYSLAQKDVWALPFWQQPNVGAGPYLWERTETGQFLSFLPNPKWRGGALSFSRVITKLITDRSVAAAQLQSGNLDAALITLDDMSGLASAGFQTGTKISPPPQYTPFNNSPASPFHDVRVRQAFMYGCNRQNFVDTYLQGKALKTDTVFFPDWVPKDGATVYNFDLQKAKQLLDDAKFDYSRTITWLSYDKDDKAMQAAAEDCQSTMGTIGVKIEILNGLDVESKRSTDGTFDLDSYGGYPIMDPDQVNQFLSCSSIGPTVNPNGYKSGGANEANYCNPKFDALMQQGASVADQTQRATIYKQAQDIFLADVPVMIQYRNATPYAWSSKLKGFVVYGDPGQTFLKIDQWSKSQ